MTFDITLNPDGAKELVQKAMFELLTEESRNELVQQALNQLTERPPKQGYGSIQQPSPLEESFNRAMNVIVTQIVSEYLNDDEIKSAIREQILAVLKRMIEEKGTWLYSQIGYAVGEKIQEVLKEEKSW